MAERISRRCRAKRSKSRQLNGKPTTVLLPLRWTLTVAPVWACEAAPGKPVGNNLAKSKEAERSALVVQRHGLEKIGWLLLSHRSFPEMSGITVNVEKT